MAKLADADLVDGTATNFATNVLEIAVPPGNPASISSFADLAKPGVKVVTCASQVPCGAATKTVEKATVTTLSPVSEESSVTDVLGKVTSGEADAAWSTFRTSKRPAIRSRASPPSPPSQAGPLTPTHCHGWHQQEQRTRSCVHCKRH